MNLAQCLIVSLVVVAVVADQDDFLNFWDCDDIKCVDMVNVGAPCFKWCPNGKCFGTVMISNV